MFVKKVCFAISIAFSSMLVYGLDCSQYIGRGYCTDYIEFVTGKRQLGNGKDWKGNISSSEVLPHDVAIFDVGTFGHVARIDSVNRDGNGKPISVNLSEWNYGSVLVNASCGVTDKFRITTYRVNVPLSSISRFWRPFGDVSGANSLYVNLNSRYALYWEPNIDSSCQNGKNWTLYDFDTSSTVRVSDNGYCPLGAGGGSESSNPYPVTGGTNSGTLPNLIANNSDIENASKVKVTTLHIKEPGFCRMQTKNVGNANAGAFQSKCWISDGAKIDKYPRDEGKEDTNKILAPGATNTEHEDFIAPEFPGLYNAVWCPDPAKQVNESNEGDNCHVEDPFTVWSNPNVLAVNVSIAGGKTVLLPGEAYSVNTTILNNGENFGKTILIGYYSDGSLIGTDRIQRENLKGGMSKIESLSVATAPMAAGMHTFRVCPDFDNRIAETNEADNCKSLVYEVRPPPPSVVYSPIETPFVTSCPLSPDPNFAVMPIIPLGDVGAALFGSKKQRIFIPVAKLSQARTKLVWGGFSGFNPSLVTRFCWGSDVTNWGVNYSTACAAGFTLQGSNWVVDIPNTPQASKGTWSFRQGTMEYWVDPSSITSLALDSGQHIRYNNWTPNRMTVVNDISGMTLNASFSSKTVSGFWPLNGSTLTGRVFWRNDKDPSPGMLGRLVCGTDGKLKAVVVDVAPNSTGRLTLGLTTAGSYRWQATQQWVLPVGATIVNKDGNYRLPTSASLFQKREVIYDKGQQKLTLTIVGDGRMSISFLGVTNISQITRSASFDAWIVPIGQTSKLIQGTVSRSASGVWTIVFVGLPPGFGGSVYLNLANGVKAWQYVSSFAFGSGIVANLADGSYVMPR